MSTPSLSLRSALPLTRPRTLALHKYLQPATTTATTTRSISTRPPPSLLRIHPGLNPRTNSSTISNISSISQPPKISSFFKSLFGSWGGPSTEEMSAAKIKAENIVKENAVGMFVCLFFFSCRLCFSGDTFRFVGVEVADVWS